MDSGLLRALAEGSEKAFSAVVSSTAPELLRFFRLLGRDAHQSEDCVQETFLRLHGYRAKISSGSPIAFRVLLYRVARNVWVDALRAERRRVALRPLGSATEPWTLDPHGPGAVDLSLDLVTSLESLPERQKAVVVLNVFQGLSYPEIATALGIPLGTVKSRMIAALERLREVCGARFNP